MITKGKIAIYRHYRGDIDGWARAGTVEQKAIMTDKDWLVIESCVQDIKLAKNGLASKSYVALIYDRLHEICDSQETIDELKAIA